MNLKILLNGSKGRMGQAIMAESSEQNVEIIGAVDTGDNASEYIQNCDAVIEFSIHSATLPIVQLAARHKKPVVIGTTGHTEEEKEQIKALTSEIPMVWAGNYSVGVNLLFYLTKKAAQILGKNYHPEIVEMHHRHKVDSPSGTAERLLEVVREARNLTSDQTQHGRHGIIGPRPDDEIGMHALRGGDVVGDHTALFAGDGERFELTHKASNRKIFAQGAIRAAHWAITQPNGLYLMEDVLGLKD